MDPPDTPSEPQPAFTTPLALPGGRFWRAGFAATLATAMGVSVIGTQVYGILAPVLTRDLGLSATDIGALVTTVAVVGALASVGAGSLVARLRGRRMLLVLFGSGIAVLLAMAVAPGLRWLLAVAALAGLPLALANPVTNQCVAVALPDGGRGIVMGVKQSGAAATAFLGGALLPVGAVTIGWRPTLALAGLVPVGGLLLTRAFVPDAGAPAPAMAAGTGRRVPTFVRWLSAYSFLMGAGSAAVGTYLSLYAYEVAGFSVAGAGFLVSTSGAMGIAGRVWWGRAAERTASPPRLLAVLAAGAALSVTAVWSAGHTYPALLWCGALGLGAFAMAWQSVVNTTVVREVAGELIGPVSGYPQTGFYAGLVAGPVTAGVAAEWTGTYGVVWAGVVGLSVAAATCALAWGGRQRRRDRAVAV